MAIRRCYVRLSSKKELCYNIDIAPGEKISGKQFRVLKQFLRRIPGTRVFANSGLNGKRVVEVGTRLSRKTPFCSQALSLLHICGFKQIIRIEVSRRYVFPDGANQKEFLEDKFDPMVEEIYPKPLESFIIETRPNPVITVPILGEGLELMAEANKKLELGLDEQWMAHFKKLFEEEGRNPTDAELIQIREMVSNHSFHWLFNGIPVINGQRKDKSLMDLIRLSHQNNPSGSVIAFHDNASAIYGGRANILVSSDPVGPAKLVFIPVFLHPSLTCETHNFPSFWYAWAGAETGLGGCIRDGLALGIGGEHRYAIAGFMSGNCHIPGYIMPWEEGDREFPFLGPETPLTFQLDAPWGTWAYGNSYGIPTIQGISRTFGMEMPNGEYYAYWKPIMFVGLAGVVMEDHITKGEPKKGLSIVQIGGPAFYVGYGGGSGSSSLEDQSNIERDMNAVQRGDALMAQKTWRVIRACVEMGVKNPIISIHDQGAAGPCNVLTELIEQAGGELDIREINVGDISMAFLGLWIAEYQERYGFLIHPDHIDMLKKICEREGCPLEILGEVTGNGRIVVYDSQTKETPIDLPIAKIREGLPKKEICDVEPANLSAPVKISDNLDFLEALKNVLRLLSVGSKAHYVNRVDNTVTGLIVQNQLCGALHLPLADVAVAAHDFVGKTGQASAIGECGPKTTLDQRAGARMAVAESITNLAACRITDFKDIKASVNWMWPATGVKGGFTKLYYSMEALSKFMTELGIACDGGKDSTSMAVSYKKETIKSPETVVVTSYGYVPDFKKVATPDIKKPGKSCLILIDHGRGKNRLGGSAFLQTLGQLGDECPDIDDTKMFVQAQLAILRLHDEGRILAYHDRSDGGTIGMILEMLMAGDCGATINLTGQDIWQANFTEEAGQIIEVSLNNQDAVEEILKEFEVEYTVVGLTSKENKVELSVNGVFLPDKLDIPLLRTVWSETAYQFDKEQTNLSCARSELAAIAFRKPFPYKMTVSFSELSEKLSEKPKVAVLRTQGTNGDREMAAALKFAEFEVWDVTMTDLVKDLINLDRFQGIVFPGGFSFQDVFGAGKGWAKLIRLGLWKIFEKFLERSDTFVLGVCNGCQAGAYLGIAPFGSYNPEKQPLFLRNKSEAFESRFLAVKILESPSIMFAGMEGSILGIPVAHGEGRIWVPDDSIFGDIADRNLATMAYVDDKGRDTEEYPFNPNGSAFGWTGVCNSTGRFNIVMPHPERAFFSWQWPWIPDDWKERIHSPWMQAFVNLYNWCKKKQNEPI